MVLGTSGADYFGLFLKSIHLADGSPRWKPTDINLIPIGSSAITVVFGTLCSLQYTLFTDYFLLIRRASLGLGIHVRFPPHPMAVDYCPR